MPGDTCRSCPGGEGAVLVFYRMTRSFSHWKRAPTDDDVAASEQALARVRKELADRRADQIRRESSQNSPSGGWLSKVAVNFRGASGTYLSDLVLTGVNMWLRILNIGSGTARPDCPGVSNVEGLGGVERTARKCKICSYFEREGACHHRSWVRHLLRIQDHQCKCNCVHRRFMRK